MMLRLLVTSIVVLFTLTVVHAAQFYKWIDSAGNVTYRDRPPPEGSGYRVEEKFVSDDAYTSPDSPTFVEKKPVKLYTVKKCDVCDLVRIYLQKRKIPFTEKDVEKNIKNQRELKKYAGSITVPSTIIGTKVITGYNQITLDQELKAGGYPKPDSK